MSGFEKYVLLTGLLIVLIAMIVPVDLGSYDSRVLDATWDLGHLLLFLIIGYSLYYFIPGLKDYTLVKQYVCVLILSALIGLTIEGLQILTGRTSSLSDVGLDVIGGVFAVTLYSPMVVKISRHYRIMVWCLMLLLLSLSIKTLVSYLWDGYILKTEFPLLGDFEKTVERSRWSGLGGISISREHASKGTQSLKIEFNSGKYSGAKLINLVHDWTGYEHLKIDIYYPKSASLKLVLSIYSEENTETASNYNYRFNKNILLQHGWNKITLPINDIKMALPGGVDSLSKIAGLMVYLVNESESQVVYLDNLRLIK